MFLTQNNFILEKCGASYLLLLINKKVVYSKKIGFNLKIQYLNILKDEIVSNSWWVKIYQKRLDKDLRTIKKSYFTLLLYPQHFWIDPG